MKFSDMKKAIPEHTLVTFKKKKNRFAIGIPIINEGKKIRKQLQSMQKLGLDTAFDILIFDGGSTDGSTDHEFLKKVGVRALLTKTGPGKQGAQLRMGFDYILKEGYEGVITIDGNGKDSIENIPDFAELLDQGYGFIQGSRFIEGGKAVNTPLQRYIAIRFLHAPWISVLSHFNYTDTTSGFRGISSELLADERLHIFRDIFSSYELLFYMSVMAPKIGYKVIETPVTRAYPKGKIPTKMKLFDNLKVIQTLWKMSWGYFQP